MNDLKQELKQQQQQQPSTKSQLDESISSDVNNVSLLTFTGAPHVPSPGGKVDAGVDVGDVKTSTTSTESVIEEQHCERRRKNEQNQKSIDQMMDQQHSTSISTKSANDDDMGDEKNVQSMNVMSPSLNYNDVNSNDKSTNQDNECTSSEMNKFTSPIPSTAIHTTTTTSLSSSNPYKHYQQPKQSKKTNSEDKSNFIEEETATNENDNTNTNTNHIPKNNSLMKTPETDMDSLLSPPNVMRKIIGSNSTIPTVPNTASTCKSTTTKNHHIHNMIHRHKKQQLQQQHHQITEGKNGQITNNNHDDDEDENIPYSPIRKLSPSSFLKDNHHFHHNDDHHHQQQQQHSNLTSIALHYGKEDRFILNKNLDMNNNEEDDDDETSSDAANSLVSEYGSDIGDIRVRMDDVHAMDAVIEDEEEEENDDDHDEGNSNDNKYNSDPNRQDKEESKVNEQEDVMISVNLSSTCDIMDHALSFDNEKEVGVIVEETPTKRSSISTIGNRGKTSKVDLHVNTQYENHHINNIEDDDDESTILCDLKQPSNPISSSTTLNQDTTPNAPIAAVSAAIRRLGTGVSQMARCSNDEENESSTFEYVPQSLDPIHVNSTSRNHHHHDQQHGHSKVWLSPRFGQHLEDIKPILQSQKSFSPTRSPIIRSPSRKQRPHTTTNTTTTTTQLLTSPLRHLRGCFSFDPESGTLPYSGALNHSSPPSSPLRLSSNTKSSHHRNDSGASGSSGGCKGRRGHRKSKSWGSSGADVYTGYQQTMKSLNVSSHDWLSGSSGAAATGNSNNPILSTPRRMRSNFMQFNANSFRSLTISSPKKRAKNIVQQSQQQQQTTMMLGSPQRIRDIEREDALDILTLLVERSLEFDKKTKIANVVDNDGGGRFNEIGEKKEETNVTDEEMTTKVEKCLHSFREHSKQLNDSPLSHDERMTILNELEQSYVYANEMRRASLSAQSWLKSVVRSTFTNRPNQSQEATRATSSFLKSELPTDPEVLKSLASSYQHQLKEKDDLNNRLNLELSTCRAEIGRLKTMKRNENHFTSPDKSILDDNDEDDDSSSSSTTGDENEFPNNNSSDIHLSINPEIIEKSSTTKHEETSMSTESKIKALESEIFQLKRQLQQAGQQSSSDDHSVAISKSSFGTESKKAMETKGEGDKSNEKDKSMVHVRMLDAENFITDWNALGPLPPPPDHELRSPIVSELLSQWTTDKSTQGSLISWMDKVMEGEDPEMIQPLQISSLNHEIREGFVMHILPLLLRRSDIHVELSSRAHRHTSYDISVSIKKSHQEGVPITSGELLNSSMAQSPHMMAFKLSGSYDWLETEHTPSIKQEHNLNSGETISVTHSATTAQISNNLQGSQLNLLAKQHPASSKKMVQDEDAQKETPQSIVSGALSAVGGLLGRRKTQHSSNRKNEGNSNISPPLNVQISEDSSSSQAATNEDDQPYHRVVSAPPGKIGITFVQYRGHAMISDVLQDSPLLGWVFPSDILIAIDEIPCSGMRVVEIVKLLTARKERQRALRLISSHAMTELLITQESGALIDG